jgi:hypothetical protein
LITIHIALELSRPVLSIGRRNLQTRFASVTVPEAPMYEYGQLMANEGNVGLPGNVRPIEPVT